VNRLLAAAFSTQTFDGKVDRTSFMFMLDWVPEPV
jgi:hypothetical protein